VLYICEIVPRASPWQAAYAIASAGLTVLLKILTMAKTNPPMKPNNNAVAPKLSVQATAPTETSTANKIAVRVTTSSIVIRPVRIDDAAGVLYKFSRAAGSELIVLGSNAA